MRINCDKNALYRTLSVSLTQLINEEDRQLNLFIDEYERRRDEKLAKTIDYLQNKYGKESYLKRYLTLMLEQSMVAWA